MPELHASLPLRRFGETARRDAWWLQSALVFVGFSAFIVYSTWAAFQGTNYEWGPYLSPFYSPLIYGDSVHALIRLEGAPSWWPGALPFSAAFLILWAPIAFRFTCYYYRGAYYKAFWADPPGCAVGEPRTGYRGERWFPLVVQNIHRYIADPGHRAPPLPGARRVEGAVVPHATAARSSASASGRSCSRQTSSCSAATRSAVIH